MRGKAATMTVTTKQHAYLQAMGIEVFIAQGASPAVAPMAAVPSTPELLPQVSAPTEIATERSGLNWAQLQSQVSNCTACELHATRTQTVFGIGNPHAEILFIGEAPGAEEDRQGEPFVGRAGQLLNEMLRAINLQRTDVYIANILKCRPPNNRDPKPEEALQCWPFLQQQIALIQPKIVVALGRIAAQRLLQTDTPLTRLRQQIHHHVQFNLPLIVTYHPAYLLRSPQDKRKAWEDLLFLMQSLRDITK